MSNNSTSQKFDKKQIIRYAVILVALLIVYFVYPYFVTDNGQEYEDTRVTEVQGSEETVASLPAQYDPEEKTDESISEVPKSTEVIETVESKTEESVESMETQTSQAEESKVSAETQTSQAEEPKKTEYRFRSKKLLNEHYEKHGIEMGFASAKEYEAAASDVVNNPDALHKIEKEDGDDIYYIEATNEFVVVSTDGYLRTYFWPSSGIKYYNKQ